MYIKLDEIDLAELNAATKRMSSKITGSDDKGSYSIHKVADNRVEVHVYSKMVDFVYRVHIQVKADGVIINPAGNYHKGEFIPIYPRPQWYILRCTYEYAFNVFYLEAQAFIPKRASPVSKPYAQYVKGHDVESYRKKNGTWVSSYKRGSYIRGNNTI